MIVIGVSSLMGGYFVASLSSRIWDDRWDLKCTDVIFERTGNWGRELKESEVGVGERKGREPRDPLMRALLNPPCNAPGRLP